MSKEYRKFTENYVSKSNDALILNVNKKQALKLIERLAIEIADDKNDTVEVTLFGNLESVEEESQCTKY